jgi:hypothetical protein
MDVGNPALEKVGGDHVGWVSRRCDLHLDSARNWRKYKYAVMPRRRRPSAPSERPNPIPATRHSRDLFAVPLRQRNHPHRRIIPDLFGSDHAGLDFHPIHARYTVEMSGSRARQDHRPFGDELLNVGASCARRIVAADRSAYAGTKHVRKNSLLLPWQMIPFV